MILSWVHIFCRLSNCSYNFFKATYFHMTTHFLIIISELHMLLTFYHRYTISIRAMQFIVILSCSSFHCDTKQFVVLWYIFSRDLIRGIGCIFSIFCQSYTFSYESIGAAHFLFILSTFLKVHSKAHLLMIISVLHSIHLEQCFK